MKIYDAFGKVPSNVLPDTHIRYWDRILLYGAVGGLGTYFLMGFLLYHIINPLDNSTLQWWAGSHTMLHYLSIGSYKAPDALYFVQQHPLWFYPRMIGLWLTSAVIAFLMARSAWKRVSNLFVEEGIQLLRDEEAIKEANARTAYNKEDDNGLWLHPNLWLPKKTLTRHIMLMGSIGSGKTQIMLRMLRQIIEKDQKAFIYDVKGDFTAKFEEPIILSPFDKRSYVWDIAKDVKTKNDASQFINCLIPEDTGSGKFWTDSARQIGLGVIMTLQNEKGTQWTFRELAELISLKAEQLAPILWDNYSKAETLISNPESQTSFNVLATLNGYTKILDDLATAWPEPGDKSFSMKEWIADDYQGKKQVIVQSGVDKVLTSSYISALINVAVPNIISPALPDNEDGRFLGFFLDELPSIGKINFTDLVDKGRSKGVVLLAGFQDLAQVEKVYGAQDKQSLQSMVGTQIICKVNQGETCKQLAEAFGSHLVGSMAHRQDGHAERVWEKVVKANVLTNEIGPYKVKRWFRKSQWGIKAIVQTGHDPLLLRFPGVELPDIRDGQTPAEWTLKPQGKRKDGKKYKSKGASSVGKQKEIHKNKGMTPGDIDNYFK